MNHKNGGLRPVDAPVFSYWQALYRSFFSSRLYVDVFKRWRGWGFLYLLLVMTVFSLPLSMRMICELHQYFQKAIIMPLEKLPELYIQDGKISIDQSVPYKIKNKKGDVIAIVDTSGEIKEITREYPKLSLLITDDTFIFRPPKPQYFFMAEFPSTDEQTYAKTIPEYATEVFDAKKWLQDSGVFTIQYLIQGIVYPTTVLTLTVLYAIFVFIFSFIAQIIASTFLDLKLKYKEACRVLAVSATPGILILLLIFAFGLDIPASSVFYLLIWTGYFFYAATCIKRTLKKMVNV